MEVCITNQTIFTQERETTPAATRHLHYISAGDGLAAVYVKNEGGADSLYYIMKDHLGSITGAINKETGKVYRQNFDAWGRKRNPQTWTYTDIPEYFPLSRGYTGHEHLDKFVLINMNGRMYDAALCRFLSPDPYVQVPDYSQNFNRYSYALNNPLVYTDPSGEFIFSALIPVFGVFIDAACWGAVLGGAGYTASVGFSDGGFNNWDWGQFGKSVGIGAISGMATAGIGSAFGAVGSGGLTGEIARAYVHGFSQGTISQLSGGDFLSGFAAGGLGSFGGSAFQMFGGKFAHSAIGTTSFSALSGGVGAELSGGNFWQGAATGATISMLNHGAQLVQNDITRRMGKFVNSREEGLNYIYNNSPVEGKEMGMVEYVTARDKTRYFVTPWNKNTSNDTYFDYSKMPKGFGTAKSKIRYHTHLSNNGPSYADFYNHSSNRNWSRSLVISRSSVWDVNRYHSPVPPRGIPTGRWLSPVSEWLKGNFINF